MLEKQNRICLDKEFDRVFKTGQSFYAKIFGLRMLANGLPQTRMGLLVGLKVSKKAVIRNKIKRQIRSIISKEIPKIKPGQDIIIVVLPAILNKGFLEIKESLQAGLTKLKAYK